jgi:hypothetical protein
MFSQGGGYELGGTIGQPDAGSPAMPLAGGDYELVGGFWPAVQGPAAPCPGDANGDRVVDNADLQAILDAWASSSGDPRYDPAADFNGNGSVGNEDLQELLDHGGDTCP